MKKIVILATAFAVSMPLFTHAQNYDSKPCLNFCDKKNNVKIMVGARFMGDVAYYHTDFTPMRSGAAITDARLRASFSRNNWMFYADMDFSKGKFSQKNIFVQYSALSCKSGNFIKFGYFNNPATMANNTSRGSLHFMSRAAVVNALYPGRELGLSYTFVNKYLFMSQGIAAENKYNNQEYGNQGFSAGFRWLVKPLQSKNNMLHFGISGYYKKLNTVTVSKNVAKTMLNLGSSMQTYVDSFMFTETSLPYASDVFNIGAEFLYLNRKMFLRGEGIYKYVTKKRDDNTLFTNQLGGIWSWTTLASWQKDNPIGPNSFGGAYVEFGYEIFGQGYKYNTNEGILNGWNGKSLEVVARYSYLNLNDIKKGEYYSLARDQYYPEGIIKDYPKTSLSAGGGSLHSVTLGLNYSITSNVQAMFEYSYNRLCRDKYVYDKNIHLLQSRLMFSF